MIFSLPRRGVYGTFHSLSRKRLRLYVAEFNFRQNAGKLDDYERLARTITASEGERLCYREPVAKVSDGPVEKRPF
jgi:hypothetical protein